jgi:hypothetical protein
MEEVEWVYVMPEQRAVEEMGLKYNIGDLVNVKYAYYSASGSSIGTEFEIKFRDYPGIVTDNAGLKDGTGEYKVLTLNGKHDWSPLSDLTLIQHLKT